MDIPRVAMHSLDATDASLIMINSLLDSRTSRSVDIHLKIGILTTDLDDLKSSTDRISIK